MDGKMDRRIENLDEWMNEWVDPKIGGRMDRRMVCENACRQTEKREGRAGGCPDTRSLSSSCGFTVFLAIFLALALFQEQFEVIEKIASGVRKPEFFF